MVATTRLAWVLCVCAIVAPAIAQPSNPKPHSYDFDVDVGLFEYDANCATCHGGSGKGDGLARRLKGPAADLTILSQKNNGLFPFASVFETIDGRKIDPAKEGRECPSWGAFYTKESRTLNLRNDPEAFARAKILAIVEHVYLLQAH